MGVHRFLLLGIFRLSESSAELVYCPSLIVIRANCCCIGFGIDEVTLVGFHRSAVSFGIQASGGYREIEWRPRVEVDSQRVLAAGQVRFH